MRTCASAGAGLGLAGLGAKVAALDSRPNILLVLVDQDRAPTHTPMLKRPNLERLRQSGVDFSHAYCSYPLCSPSRSTILTGKYPHQVGVFANIDFIRKTQSLSPETPNLGRVFSRAGYQTAYFGKWHLTRGPHNRERMRKYGFGEMHISNEAVAVGSDEKVLAAAARWIQKQKARGRPWLGIVSPVNPHDICFPFLAQFYGEIPEYPVSLPPNFNDDPGRLYPGFGEYLKSSAIKIQRPRTEAGWKRYLDFYCFLTELIDRNISIVLEALSESGQEQDTVVVYSSDHGEMAGSHGLVNKSMGMYEENLHIPLVISCPRLASRAVKYGGLVSNIDLVPTLASLAGVSWPEPLPGFDLSPILNGKAVSRPEMIFAEGKTEYEGASPWRGVRTANWKYWRYQDGAEFLFELESDPLELNNLAGESSFREIKRGLQEQLKNFQLTTRDPLLTA